MIDSIIKVLNKLKSHIDKYNIICKYYKEKEEWHGFLIPFTLQVDIQYTINDTKYSILIYDDCIHFVDNKHNKIIIDYSNEINKLEILKLAALIHQRCKDKLSCELVAFANEEID